MPRKSQKSEKISLESESRRSSRSSIGALPQENPAFAVDSQYMKATSESPPLEKSKMADNWDRLKARTDPDVKLPVATSRKSASHQQEVVPTRQARRCRDVSLEIENADTNPPIGASLPVASKRSGTPLPPSFFEANKKKKMSPSHSLFDNFKPNSADGKLPAAVGTSKQFEAVESLEKSELELNQNKENSKSYGILPAVKAVKVRNPLPEGKEQDPAPKSASSVADTEEASCEPMEISARGMLGPSGNDEYFLEQFHKFYEDYKASNARLTKRLLKLETSDTQKHYENMSLKSRLNIMTDKYKTLEKRLALEDQLYHELHEKYIDALKARTTIEKESEVLHERAKVLLDQQSAELGENQSEMANLRAELKNMQETNSGMASVLSDLQLNLKNTEETSSHLFNKNNEQAEELEQQKRKIQDAVAERETLERRNSELESELEQRTLECNDLKQRQADFDELQLQNEEITLQLESALIEKETTKNFLNERIEDLEAARNVLIDINEEYSKESMDLKAEKATYNETIAILRSTGIQQANEIKELTKSHKLLEGANLQQLSLHSAEIQEYKAQKLKLEEIIKSFENQLQVQAESLKAEQESRIKETHKGEVLKSEFKGERERYQADIDALKTALEHRDKESSAEQAKMQSLEAELDELRKINSSLKNEIKQKDNEMSAAKKTIDEEMESRTNNLKQKISGLQEELKQKEIEMVGLEHEKNGIIKQLKKKMSTICSTIGQPIIASGLPKSQEPQKPIRLPRKSEVKPTAANSPPSSSKKRKDQKIDYIDLQSDFDSEDDDIPVKLLFSKRENLAVVKPQEDLFDALKKENT